MSLCSQTPLLHAAKHNHHLMVADLIRLGANVNETNNLGKSCLHLSAEKGYIRVLEVWAFPFISKHKRIMHLVIEFQDFFKNTIISCKLYVTVLSSQVTCMLNPKCLCAALSVDKHYSHIITSNMTPVVSSYWVLQICFSSYLNRQVVQEDSHWCRTL